ncbi:peptide-methionine (S)-S-oxide reductase MsrA [Fontivita pretiosa]|uniref:peptide-methionine (S)-S-oxide reductase MsrA n=1 Tax=Fontivita pretiosa TaxID=2989684 RepID=UPI003D1715D1
MTKYIQGVFLMCAMSLFGGASCAKPSHAASELPQPQTDLPTTQPGATATAVFAGGCFWCTEAVFEQLNGVIDVVSGYAGDTRENADYEKVSSGQTRHAEAIQITYDPSKITYGQLLRVFFATHDPTTKDRQGPDWGRQYRSAIFYANDEQKRVAEAYIKQLSEARVFAAPIVTTVEPLGAGFFPAEQYHQDFVKLHPDHPYVVQNALPKVQKLKQKFAEQIKSER